MTLVKTNERLLDALTHAARQTVTAAQLHQQRVAFILSSFDKDETVTKERVEKELNRLDGQAA